MFRKRTNTIDDMSDEEFLKYEEPHIQMLSNYLEEYLIPDYVAFYIATGYYGSFLLESTFKQHFNSAADMFNHTIQDMDKVIEKIKTSLKIKYSLEIVEQSPILKVKEI